MESGNQHIVKCRRQILNNEMTRFITKSSLSRPVTTANPGLNRGIKLCIIQKTCFSLGSHNIQKVGFIFQRICRCLQPILTPVICESVGAMRLTVGHTDPGSYPRHVHINVPTPSNFTVYHWHMSLTHPSLFRSRPPGGKNRCIHMVVVVSHTHVTRKAGDVHVTSRLSSRHWLHQRDGE
jgi:hypothetical protein